MGTRRRCNGFHHGPYVVSGNNEPELMRNRWNLTRCTCDEFAPGQTDPVTCNWCYHAEKDHASFPNPDAVRIKKKVLEAVTRKFGGKRYGVPPAPGASLSRELKNFVPRNLAVTVTLDGGDIYSDLRICALLDEGCHRTCHGRPWRKNAEMKLEGRTLPNGSPICLGPLTGTRKHYGGLGRAETAGRRVVPWGIDLDNGMHLRGDILSNETTTPAGLPLLLGLSAQATLGLVNDTRRGRCWIPDFEAELRLYEVVNCALRAICISEFEPRRGEPRVSTGPALQEPEEEHGPRTPQDDSIDGETAEEEDIDLRPEEEGAVAPLPESVEEEGGTDNPPEEEGTIDLSPAEEDESTAQQRVQRQDADPRPEEFEEQRRESDRREIGDDTEST